MTQEHVEPAAKFLEKTASTAIGPGKRLQAERVARNLELDEVAKHLRLSSRRLSLIEADNYAEMGAIAFARGHLRGYARYLSLSSEDEEKIIQSFDELGLGTDIHSNAPKLIYEKMSEHVNYPITRWLGYLVFLAVIVVVGLWWHNHSNAGKTVAAEDKPTAATTSELNAQGISQVVDPRNIVSGADAMQSQVPLTVSTEVDKPK